MTSPNPVMHGLVNNTPRARVLRHLREWIEDGRLVAGSRLPSEMQLAGKLNVSRSTIHLALSTLNKEGLIHSANRQWIVKGDVSPSRSLLTECIALIAESRDSALDYSHSLHTSGHMNFIQMGAFMAIRKAGYNTFIVHPNLVAEDFIERVITQRPKGAIIISPVLQERSGKYLLKTLHEGNIPFVIYGDLESAAEGSRAIDGIDTVISDHEAGSYALTKWLISQGRRRILRFWETPWKGPKERLSWLSQRDLGYERAMREAGLEPMPALEIYEPIYPLFGITPQDFAFRIRVIAGYLVEYLQGPEPIDAIMALTDSLVGQVSAAVRLHGKEPNKDILLVGYDNLWDDLEDIKKWEPLGPAATIDKRNLEIGSNLMGLLQERIEGTLFKEGERRVVKPDLVLRSSAYANTQVMADYVTRLT